jgi:uncharacterized membrane protein YhaH (DUF805 family)
MNFQDSVKTCLSKYVDFKGRASRSEYWWFILFSFILQIVAQLINQNLVAVVAIALLLPSLAVLVRRLHDIDYSGWWALLLLVPLIGPIVLIIFAATKGTVGPNRFGLI